MLDSLSQFISRCMKEINGIKLILPTLISTQLLQKSGRFVSFPKELFHFYVY